MDNNHLEDVIEERKEEVMENKDVEKDGKAFRFLEMEDSINESIRNAKQIIEQQFILIDVIKNSDKSEYFKNFVTACEKQIEDMNNQINALNHKLALLDYINRYPDKVIIEKIIDVLGIFNA